MYKNALIIVHNYSKIPISLYCTWIYMILLYTVFEGYTITPLLHWCNPFELDFVRLTRWKVHRVISRNRIKSINEAEGFSWRALSTIPEPIPVSSDSHPITSRTCLYAWISFCIIYVLQWHNCVSSINIEWWIIGKKP